MPPISCTSKWRIFSTRQLPSRQTANASGRISSRTSFSAAVFFVGVFDRIHTIVDALAELIGFGPKLLIRELLYLGFERVDALHQRHQALHFALVAGAKNLGH